MISKRIILLLCVLLLSISILGVCANEYQQNNQSIQDVLENYDDNELTGCCSVMLQLEGNDSVFSFRRDAEFGADIFIEKIDWHGMDAIKQYKTSGGYFCQVIITSDGWMIGYGGLDDGPDNEKIEEITSGMITEDYSISDEGLAQIQDIKSNYPKGHVFIKAPNGNYGIATGKGHFTGKLLPGEYISMPNNYNYFRSGNISLNDSDKIATLTDLAASDMFGLTRRDISTFYYHDVDNDTFKGTVVDCYLSNDDGSRFGLGTAGLADDVYFNNTLFKAEDIPFAPDYEYMGTIVFSDETPTFESPFNSILSLAGLAISFINNLICSCYYWLCISNTD
jgi:hypothetical protein